MFTRTISVGALIGILLPLAASAETLDSAKNLLYSRNLKSIERSPDLRKFGIATGVQKPTTFATKVYQTAPQTNANTILTSDPKNGTILDNSKLDPKSFEVNRAAATPWETVSPNNRIQKAFWTSDVQQKAYFKPAIPAKQQVVHYTRPNRPNKDSLDGERSGINKLQRWYLQNQNKTTTSPSTTETQK